MASLHGEPNHNCIDWRFGEPDKSSLFVELKSQVYRIKRDTE